LEACSAAVAPQRHQASHAHTPEYNVIYSLCPMGFSDFCFCEIYLVGGCLQLLASSLTVQNTWI